LLLTHVKRELAGVLPDHVLIPSLELVAAELALAVPAPARRGLFGRRKSGSTAESATPARSARRDRKGGGRVRNDAVPDSSATPDPFDSDELKGRTYAATAQDSDTLDREVKKRSVFLPAVDLPGSVPNTQGGLDLEPLKVAEQLRPAVSGAVAAVTERFSAATEAVATVPRSTPVGLSVPAGMVERVIRTFAELETVRQIVVIDGMDVTQVRGEGLTTDGLAALTVATKGLLNRAGDLRVFSLESNEGVVFLFPTRDGAVVVLTHP